MECSQAQNLHEQLGVAAAYWKLSDRDRNTLARELALTGFADQQYATSTEYGGPAFLIYYSPAFLRTSCCAQDVPGGKDPRTVRLPTAREA